MKLFLVWSSDVFLAFLPSDAFDSQYGAVILRLTEGLDVSHIQGQGIPKCWSSMLRTFNWIGFLGSLRMWKILLSVYLWKITELQNETWKKDMTCVFLFPHQTSCCPRRRGPVGWRTSSCQWKPAKTPTPIRPSRPRKQPASRIVRPFRKVRRR